MSYFLWIVSLALLLDTVSVLRLDIGFVLRLDIGSAFLLDFVLVFLVDIGAFVPLSDTKMQRIRNCYCPLSVKMLFISTKRKILSLARFLWLTFLALDATKCLANL